MNSSSIQQGWDHQMTGYNGTTTFEAPENCTLANKYYNQPTKTLARIVAHHTSEDSFQLKNFLEHYSRLYPLESIVIVTQQQSLQNNDANVLLDNYAKKGVHVWTCQRDEQSIHEFYARRSDFIFHLKLNEFIAVLKPGNGQQEVTNSTAQINLEQRTESAYWSTHDFSSVLKELNYTANAFIMEEGLLTVQPQNHCSSNQTFCQDNIFDAAYIQKCDSKVKGCGENIFMRGNDVQAPERQRKYKASKLMLIRVEYNDTIEMQHNEHDILIPNMIRTEKYHNSQRTESSFRPFMERLAATALVTLAYEASLGHVLEFVKICLQTAPVGTSYSAILTSITGEKGILGLYDGFIPWGFIQSFLKGAVFGLAYSIVKAHLLLLARKGILPMTLCLTLSGGIAGWIQGYVLSPLLLLKTRVMTNQRFRTKMSLSKTTLLSMKIGSSVIHDEGILSLMKGSNMFALKRFFDWSSRFFFSNAIESIMLKHSGIGSQLSPQQRIVASLVGGIISAVVTAPLDFLVATAQDIKNAGKNINALSALGHDRGKCWLGIEVRIVHVCLTTVVVRTGSDMMQSYLFTKLL